MTTELDPRSPAAPDRSDRSGRHRRAILVTTCLALATVVSAVASLNVALPSLARDTGATQTQLSWIVDAYALVFAALLLPAGALGDRYGRRRALLAGLAIFGGGAVAAASVDEPAALVALRGVLGLGAALVMPATLSTITSTFPREHRVTAVGTWAGVAGASAVLGLLISGLVLEQWSWRGVFVTSAVFAAVAIVATVRVVPESADPSAPRPDAMGALLSVAGLGIVVFSVIEAPTAGWTSGRTLLGLAAGLAVLAGFVLHSLRTAHPLLDPRLFAHHEFTRGTVTIAAQFLAFFEFLFLVLQYLQLVLAHSPLVAALSLVPMAFGMMSAARVAAPRLSARVGGARTSLAGLLLAAAALVLLSTLDAGSSYWPLLCGVAPLGFGMGLAMTPATAAITDALPAAQQGVGSAVNDLARELGGALGIAVLGSVLQSVYRARLDVTGLPTPIAERARESLALAARIDPRLAVRARDAFADGMQAALLGGAGVVLLAALVGALLRRR